MYTRTLNQSNIYLTMNTIINTVVGMCIFLFNLCYTLVLDTPAVAIWNSVALDFIIEIANRFKPNWNRIKLETLLAELLMDYCLAKVLIEDAKNNIATVDRGEITIQRRTGPSIDGPANKFYTLLLRGTMTSNVLVVIKEAIRTNVMSGGLRMQTPSKREHNGN